MHKDLRVFRGSLAVLTHLKSHKAFIDSVCKLDRAVLVSFTVAVLDEIAQLIDSLVVEAVANKIDVESLFAGGHVCH